jgi:hypothetical protein
VRSTPDGWTEPRPVAEDGWTIPGCPVNGPAVAASDVRVFVAWFTGAAGQPAVRAAASDDGGATFAPPILLDGDRPLGRVDVALTGETAWVTWLDRTTDGAAVRLARLSLGGGAAALAGEPATLAATGDARSSGFPRTLALDDHRLLVTWVDTGETQRVRTAIVEVASP